MLRVLFWTCFAAAMAIYIAMILWSLPVITEAAGGLAPFDMRPFGYTLADAQAFLSRSFFALSITRTARPCCP